MGKYQKYFCMSTQNILFVMGTTMAVFSLVSIIFNMLFFYIMIHEINDGYKPSVVVMIFPLITTALYFVSAFTHCALCCRSCYTSVDKFFKFYIIMVVVFIILSFIDIFIKSSLNFIFVLASVVYFISNILCLIVAIMVRHELKMDELDNLQHFNTGQGTTIGATDENNLPKFAMPLYVGRIGHNGPPEAEPMNQN